MTTQVVVVGSGYAGAGAVKAFEDEVGAGEAELTWVAEHDYHLVLHEVHRAIRNPAVEDKLTIPVGEIMSPESTFHQGRVVNVDTDERVVETADEATIPYDYLLLAVGSTTAFFGIDGLKEHAHQLKCLQDARDIHEDVQNAAAAATRADPATVVVGGAGLSGIQTAGEVAEYRDKHRAPIDIVLVEGLDEVFPGNDPAIQGALRQRLEEAERSPARTSRERPEAHRSARGNTRTKGPSFPWVRRRSHTTSWACQSTPSAVSQRSC